MKPLRFTMLLTAALCLVGCSTTGPDAEPVVFHFDFAEGQQGWKGLFVNYPMGKEEMYELAVDYRTLPPPLDTTQKALYISGSNYSDDLAMLFKRRVEGLAPNVTYSVAFEVEIATNAPTGCVGIGGPPGEAVVVQAAAYEREPARVLDHNYAFEPYYKLDVIIAYGEAWYDVTEVGHVANSLSCEEALRMGMPYRLKHLESGPGHWQVTADDDGRAWLLVGTRSGFEGTTSLYYTEVTARFIPL